MSPDVSLLVPHDDALFEGYRDLLHESFAGFGQPGDRTRWWLNNLGRENLRVALVGDEIVGGLGLVLFGQWFGGRAVSSAGISAVAVAAHRRGEGAGAAMMKLLMRELADDGFALSSLYPSTIGLYRKAGYELAGSRITCALPVSNIRVCERSLRLRPFESHDLPGIRHVYHEYARRASGAVDRGGSIWNRLIHYPPDPGYARVVETADGEIQGYIIYTLTNAPLPGFDIRIREMAASTPAAARRLLTFLADHGTVAGRAIWQTGLIDPILFHGVEELIATTVDEPGVWMLRVLNVSAALQGRGYPPGMRAQLRLAILDDVLPDNAGVYDVLFADGNATVTRIAADPNAVAANLEGVDAANPKDGAAHGCPVVRMDVRTLASLYTGRCNPLELQGHGRIDGQESSLRTLGALFSGPSPWMNDRF